VRLVIRVDKDFRAHVDKRWLRRLVKESLGAHGVETQVELSLLITDDATVRELNKTYRGKDKATDVLSFALEADRRGDAAAGFVMPPGEMVHLGEVIVSYPKAAEQAAERKHPVEDELALLVVHGVLHLLGYDHDKPAREREMRSLEQRVLSAVQGRAGQDRR
jgi:probable rRNA maturation factor